MPGVALITGCSTGIGHAIALEMARGPTKPTVYASMRNPGCPGGLELVEIAAAERLGLKVIALDVTDPARCEAVVREIAAEDGPIEVLVNNAGVGGSLVAVEEMPEEGFRAIMDANFFGPIRLSKLVIPAMRARGDGVILNVSSVLGRVATMCQAGYCASKHALEAASEAMAIELGRFGVRVKIIEPGVILTAILTKQDGHPGAGPERLQINRGSPYLANSRFMSRWYNSLGALGQQPELVAKAVAAAAADLSGRLRYTVGRDAGKFTAARPGLPDEVWLEQGGTAMLGDPAVAQKWYRRHFDLDVSAGFRGRKSSRAKL